jgi:hypothetical protein
MEDRSRSRNSHGENHKRRLIHRKKPRRPDDDGGDREQRGEGGDEQRDEIIRRPPDRLVFDLDPGPGTTIVDCAQVARR